MSGPVWLVNIYKNQQLEKHLNKHKKNTFKNIQMSGLGQLTIEGLPTKNKEENNPR